MRRFQETFNGQVNIVEKGDVVFITPDVAVYRFTSEYSGYVDEDGKPLPPGKGQAVRVYVKKDGKWLLAVTGLNRPEE